MPFSSVSFFVFFTTGKFVCLCWRKLFFIEPVAKLKIIVSQQALSFVRLKASKTLPR
jgi:hypothetical protein